VSVHVATAEVRPAQGGVAVTVYIHDHHLRNSAALGEAISAAVIESLARSIQKSTGGLIVPCRRCGAQMVIVTESDTSSGEEDERGLSCPTRTCPGSDEFWPVP
jgi:hypothetical protein